MLLSKKGEHTTKEPHLSSSLPKVAKRIIEFFHRDTDWSVLKLRIPLLKIRYKFIECL